MEVPLAALTPPTRRQQVEKKTVLENLDLVLLAMDEIVDGGCVRACGVMCVHKLCKRSRDTCMQVGGVCELGMQCLQ
jgi:hypothetical protein